MDKQKIDSLIQDTLYQATDNLKAPSGLQQSIHETIKKQSKEVVFMRKFGWKKMIVAAAALCILGSMVAIGAGRITSTVSSSSPTANQFPAFEDLEKAEAELGYPIQKVKEFSNGYQYAKGNIDPVQAMDDNGTVVDTYQDLSLLYTNSEKKKINLSISRPAADLPEPNVGSKESRDISGVPVSYNCDHYKFYPADVTPSEEDLKAEANGELYLSYGTSEIEESYFYSVTWSLDGILYNLYTMDNPLSADEMFTMAKELIEVQ